jgi:hypothetical protein
MQNRQDRVYPDSNTSIAGQVQVFNFVAAEAQAIHDGLAIVPESIYPDNPGQAPLMPNVDTVNAGSVMTKMLTWLSPLAFMTSWANTWNHIKRYAKEENKNFEKTLDLTVNVLTTATSTTILALILTGAIYAAPYLIASMLGVGMAYGFFNIMKHSYHAYRASKEADKEKRNAHLWEIPKQMLSTAVNALGFVLNLSLAFQVGPQLSTAYDKLTTAIKNWDMEGVKAAIGMTQSAGAVFNAMRSVLYGLGAVVTLGAVPSLTAKAFQHNADTWEAVTHPIQSLKKLGAAIKEGAQHIWTVIKKRPYVAPFVIIPVALEVVSAVVQTISRVAALALAPVQLIGKGIAQVFSFFKSGASHTQPIALSQPLLQQANDSTFQVNAALQAKHHQLKTMIADEVTHLKTQPQTKKIQSKLYCMEQFNAKLGADVNGYERTQSVRGIESQAKTISPYLKQSFWRSEGRVEKISRQMQAFDAEIQSKRVSRVA